jgi:hypothetical protein
MVTLIHGACIHACSETSGLVEKKIIKSESLFLLQEYGSVTDGVGALHSLNYISSVLSGRNSIKFHLKVQDVLG